MNSWCWRHTSLSFVQYFRIVSLVSLYWFECVLYWLSVSACVSVTLLIKSESAAQLLEVLIEFVESKGSVNKNLSEREKNLFTRGRNRQWDMLCYYIHFIICINWWCCGGFDSRRELVVKSRVYILFQSFSCNKHIFGMCHWCCMFIKCIYSSVVNASGVACKIKNIANHKHCVLLIPPSIFAVM